MATLVLSVVGGMVGGPVGAAIGAALGQQVDAAVFRPKGREGPRLADLKVQASTYGQQIPQLFGTLRVAGSVIWATDLIERRSKRGGGKGRPSVTEYSYAVSLAVALSSRRIRAIRRIWADGNLLRGTSGTFQERCIFRWHDGGEDQAVDPLIASAVGPGSASGFRGLAYVVFEELELGAFGNRIPSLTFEIEADAGSVDAGVREERIDLPAVLPATSARALAQRLAAAAADGRETLIWQADLAALALPVGRIVTLADGSAWRLAARNARANEVLLELRRHQPVPVAELPAAPGVPVRPPDWPDAVGTVQLFDLPNIGSPGAATAQILITAAGSNDGWRGADCWFVPAVDAEPVALGTVRPAAALGHLAEPLAPGSEYVMDHVRSALVTLVNPSMTLESVHHAALLAGANRAMVAGELLQFATAEPVGAGVWRLSRLLRGRAGTGSAAAHAAGAPFVLLDDSAPMLLPEALARVAEGGGARLQWAPRGGSAMTEVAIPAGGRALSPLAPVHGRISPDGAGGVRVAWRRRSRVDTGWRDHVDLPLGEGREAWQIALSPPVPGIAPWERATPDLQIAADVLAALPPGTTIAIRQVGDFALSPPLSLSLT